MSNTKTIELPKGIKFAVVFTEGEYDQDATMRGVNTVLQAYVSELAQDEETISAAVMSVRLARGKDGVMLSTMPRDFLVAELHKVLGSLEAGADGDLYRRNDAKIENALSSLCVAGGKSGVRFASPEEIAAVRLIKAARKAARKAAKDAEKAAFAAFKAAQTK